ncbi:MAG: hypothetical protein Q7S60_05945, partial [bacterium]|nr:hypothetical protein [bacterium]
MLNIKNFLLDLFFPKTCFSCQREGDYLCQDCKATLEVSSLHKKFSTLNLSDLYFPVPYQNPLIKNLIQKFKYEPFAKELAKPLSSLIIEHFQLLDNKPDFSNAVLIPAPLGKKRLKWRGFNQSQKLAEELAGFLGLKILTDVL